MRNSPALEALFPRIRSGVLAAAYTHPDRWRYLTELASFLGTSPSSLQRELAALVHAGLLEQRREANRTYYRARRRSPLYRELRSLFEKTAGVLATIRNGLQPYAAEIQFAFVYGSFARSQEHEASDVDLMVAGSIGLAELTPALRDLERKLGRDINVITYSTDEFRNKAKAGDHFLNAVLRGPKQFVLGDKNELDAVVGQPRSTKARAVKTRAG
jgi:predicted nucleotidyltransferase